jgi:hypothetical protein
MGRFTRRDQNGVELIGWSFGRAILASSSALRNVGLSTNRGFPAAPGGPGIRAASARFSLVTL